jgi:diketogulonate reductase-like aldo/keto reductase
LQSFRASLANLRTGYLDSLVMHSPEIEQEQTIEVWHAFEHIYSEGGARYLGLNNCYDLPVFESLYSDAKVIPSFLQNRFYSQSGYDREIRSFCDEEGIKYQGFWTLTANPKALERCISWIVGVTAMNGINSFS